MGRLRVRTCTVRTGSQTRPSGRVPVDRFQVAATGLSLGASALLLSLGVGLVCDVRAREERAQANMQEARRTTLARIAIAERSERQHRLTEISRLRAELKAQEAELAAARRVRVQASREQ